jgi:hypothetical protein
MLSTALNALALLRFGMGRGLGFFQMLVLLAVVGGIVWALTRPREPERPKD